MQSAGKLIPIMIFLLSVATAPEIHNKFPVLSERRLGVKTRRTEMEYLPR